MPAAVNSAPDIDTQKAADEPSPAPIGRSELTTTFAVLHLHKSTNNHIDYIHFVSIARLLWTEEPNPKMEA